MPLKVALLENIFWTNGSYSKPATLPDSTKFETIGVTPVMLSPYVGHVVITGDYNYAEFKDVLYFLSPIELKDQTKGKIKYLLTRDEWAFAVRNKTKVAGTVVKTLDEKLLTENIQLTQPAIPNPAKLNIVNLIEDEEYTTSIIDPINLSFPQIVLSGRGVEQLISTSSSSRVSGLTPYFEENWKRLITPYIRKLIDGIGDEKYMLTKVSQIESSFKFFWCLTVDEQSKRIGDIKEKDVYIEKVDFSGLTDIKPLSIVNHVNPAKANTKLDLSKTGSTSIKSYSLDLEKVEDKYLVRSGGEELLNNQLVKRYDNYYLVDKKDQTFLKPLPWPTQKEFWEKSLRTNGVVIEKDLNDLDAILTANRVHRFNSFGSNTQTWIKNISPNFKQSEDLNPPLPRLADRTFDFNRFYEDYLNVYYKFDSTESPFAAGLWIVFSSKPRPKFFYQLLGDKWTLAFKNWSRNIQSLINNLNSYAVALSRDAHITKKNIFNSWYYLTDSTYEPPGLQEDLGSIYTVKEKDLETGMHLYDLVGTDYLLLIYKNEPHLIFQNAQIRAKGRRLSITAQEQIPEFDIFESVNQCNNLQVFNKSFPLKDKITKSYQFNTEIKVITDPNSIAYDYAFVRHQGFLDNICEAIEFPKSKLAATASVSAVEVENNYIAQQRNYEDLQLKRREATLRRSNEDLEWSFNWEEYGIKRATALVTFAIGVAAIGASGAAAGGIAQAYLGAKGAGKLVGGVSSFLSSNLEYNKLTAAQQQQLEARLLENYSLELTHHRYDYDLKRNLKNMGNVAQAAAVTYRDVMDKYNFEIGANEIHLRIWTPTNLQMRMLETLYQETGVDCLIDQVTIQIDSNLSGIWRFSVIDAIGSEDGMSISFLTALLQNGVRIVPNDVVFKQPIQAIQSFLLPEHIKRELGILRERAANSETSERVYKGLISYTNVGLIQEKEEEIQELIKQKEDLQKISGEYFEQAKEFKQVLLDKEEQITKLEQSEKELIDNQGELNNKISELYKAQEECQESYKQAKLNLERLDKELSDLKAEQTQEREKCEEDIKEAKDTIRRLRKDYEDKALQLKELLKDRNKLAQDLQATQDELENYKKQNQELNRKLNEATDLARQIEEQKKQIEEQANQLAAQKAELERRLEEERNKQPIDPTTIKRYEDQLEEIKAKEEEARNRLNQLQEELKGHTELSQCLTIYKEQYKLIYDQYLKCAKYIYEEFLRVSYFVVLLDELIIPGVVNNYWYASQYRAWFAKYHLSILSFWSSYVWNWNKGESKIAIPVNHYRTLKLNKSINSLDELVKENDPNEKHLGWWISKRNYNVADKNSDKIYSDLKTYSFSPWVTWSNLEKQADRYINPEIWKLYSPEELEQCVPAGEVKPKIPEPVPALDITQTPEYKALEKQRDDCQRTLTTTINNLNRYREDYAELEKENTQNKNLVTLYKAEADKLKKELEEAKKKPDGK